MQDGYCAYLARWDAVKMTGVIAGEPANTALERVVDDLVVIFDEDPDPAYRTEFKTSQISIAISTFLVKNENLSVDNHFELIGPATNESMEAIRDAIRDELSDNTSIVPQQGQSIILTDMPRPRLQYSRCSNLEVLGNHSIKGLHGAYYAGELENPGITVWRVCLPLQVESQRPSVPYQLEL